MKSLETNKTGMEAPQKYEAPVIEMIEIEVEKGFAASPNGQGDGDTGNGNITNPTDPTDPGRRIWD